MDPSLAWIETLAELKARGTPCALVVVTGVKGSTPREVGARMVVAEGRVVRGTVGGGNLERLAIERAGALLARGAPAAETLEVPLAESAGQCCGGHVTLLVDDRHRRRRSVAIFGAGHVGQALAGLAPWLQADVQVVDPRPEAELVPTPPAARPWQLVTTDDPPGEVALLPDDAALVVMTHSHPLDLDVLTAALRRGGFPYLGLIGSIRKWKRFRARLLERGFEESALARVTCPLGVSIGSKEPHAIALSTATQLAETLARVRG